MNPRKVILFLIALAIAIALSFLVSGCFMPRASAPPSRVEPLDAERVVIDVPELGFMFDADQWWVIRRNQRPYEVVPVILTNQVFSAQVLLAVHKDEGKTLQDLAWEGYRYESRATREMSPMVNVSDGPVPYMMFWYHVGSDEENMVQERIAYAMTDTLPDLLFIFYGTWMEGDEEDMEEQMEVMIETLRPMPPEYLRMWEGGRLR